MEIVLKTNQNLRMDAREQIKNWKQAYRSKLVMFTSVNDKAGCGCYAYKNGNRYEGDWEDNLRHGYGRMMYYIKTHPLDSCLETYEGDWVRGQKSGYGRFTFANGDRYEGEFTEGRREGIPG